jgi:hypothetical protein
MTDASYGEPAESNYGERMAGAIAIVVVLLLFPVVALMGCSILAGVLGQLLWRDGQTRHEGSELVVLND